MSEFRLKLAEDIFNHKYRHPGAETWNELAETLVEHVCNPKDPRLPRLPRGERKHLVKIIQDKKFIPAGRYLYYAGRPVAFFNNCFCFRAVDSREGWAELLYKITMSLMCGGGVGVDYSAVRAAGLPIAKTGGTASGPIPLMRCANEIGRNVRQGGSRRSALWAGLKWNHPDILQFLTLKNWDLLVQWRKSEDFNYPADMDMTNISILFDDEWYRAYQDGDSFARDLWTKLIYQMLSTGEPGACFNFGKDAEETLRNACTEVTAIEDSTVCNLGSINLAAIDNITELIDVVYLASQFLYMGTFTADLPFYAAAAVRRRNREIGLGIMGLHEWMIKRGYKYGDTPEELEHWMECYCEYSQRGADSLANAFGERNPRKYRAIAPTGTISILAGTTSGIEPIFAPAIKRRYLKGNTWYYQYVIDPVVQYMHEEYGIDPDSIESAQSLAARPEVRIDFQAWLQQFVDMGISSTVNLPAWGTKYNNEGVVELFSKTLFRNCRKLRGITVYPNGARSGQPLEVVSFKYASKRRNVEYEEFSSYQCKSGVCGI